DAVGARLALVRAVVPAVRVGRAVAFAFREIDFLDLDRRGFASAGIELIDQNLQLVIVEPAHRQHRTALRNAETADDHLLAAESAHPPRARTKPDLEVAAEPEACLAEFDVIRLAPCGVND